MRDIATKAIGAKFYYQDCNAISNELENLVTTSGQTLSEPDNYQITKAVATYSASGNFYTDTGTANHYVLSAVGTRRAPIVYEEGMSVRFRALNANTGVSDINVAGLGLKTIKKEDGITDLGVEDIIASQVNEVIYNASTGCFELYSHKYEDQVFKTGDNLWTDNIGTRAGWIWVNDNTKTTIGNAVSGSTIRANADCQALFTLYWAFNALDCPMYTSAGAPQVRGVSAAADWSANRRMAIPVAFRRVFAAHDISDPTLMRIGQVEGEKAHKLSENELAKHTHSNSHAADTGDRVHGDGSLCPGYQSSHDVGNTGTDVAHNNMQPTIYKNLYIKL